MNGIITNMGKTLPGVITNLSEETRAHLMDCIQRPYFFRHLKRLAGVAQIPYTEDEWNRMEFVMYLMRGRWHAERGSGVAWRYDWKAMYADIDRCTWIIDQDVACWNKSHEEV